MATKDKPPIPRESARQPKRTEAAAGLDTAAERKALRAFKKAWEEALVDYAERRLNTEACLQSALYASLRRLLAPPFEIYVDAVVKMPKSDQPGAKRKAEVDLLICHGDDIVAAIELKFAPRGKPSRQSVKKDVKSLTNLRNRRAKQEQVVIEMNRYRHEGLPVRTLSIARTRKLVFAVFCQEEAPAFQTGAFWTAFRLDGQSVSSPPQFAVAVAGADKDGAATARFFGQPFDRLGGKR